MARLVQGQWAGAAHGRSSVRLCARGSRALPAEHTHCSILTSASPSALRVNREPKRQPSRGSTDTCAPPSRTFLRAGGRMGGWVARQAACSPCAAAVLGRHPAHACVQLAPIGHPWHPLRAPGRGSCVGMHAGAGHRPPKPHPFAFTVTKRCLSLTSSITVSPSLMRRGSRAASPAMVPTAGHNRLHKLDWRGEGRRRACQKRLLSLLVHALNSVVNLQPHGVPTGWAPKGGTTGSLHCTPCQHLKRHTDGGATDALASASVPLQLLSPSRLCCAVTAVAGLEGSPGLARLKE